MKAARRYHTCVALAIAFLQCIACIRVASRFLKLPQIKPLQPVEADPYGDVTIIVPVLNEVQRLTPLLHCLLESSGAVATVLVIDGASTDGTPDLVNRYIAMDPRMQYVDAGVPPAGWNGKAWNMQRGLDLAITPYVLYLDADVTVAPFVVGSLRAALQEHKVAAMSIAANQTMRGIIGLALHAALLTTFVYRHGIPGHRTEEQADAVANGQVFFCVAEALRNARAIEQARTSRCDDLTIVHALIAAGHATAFAEFSHGISVAMYTSWHDLARNWPRSLALSDQFNRVQSIARLLDVFAVQGLPLPITIARPRSRFLRWLNIGLLLMRIGVLAGTARVYAKRNIGYWFSPLGDMPAICLILLHAAMPHPRWRGRRLARKGRS